jgi:hypothetical protein
VKIKKKKNSRFSVIIHLTALAASFLLALMELPIVSRTSVFPKQFFMSHMPAKSYANLILFSFVNGVLRKKLYRTSFANIYQYRNFNTVRESKQISSFSAFVFFFLP